MNHDASNMSWLERLGHALTRPRNQEELVAWLRDIAEHHLIEYSALKMIEGVLQVYDMQVRDIMIPRSQMVVLDMKASLETILSVVIDSGHSRYPVIHDNVDEIVGILLAKDLLAYQFPQNSNIHLNNILRPAIFIPESKRLSVLLQEFRLSRNHMAIVVDEYGGVSGLLTIEDVLEEIVGDIEDEYDMAEGPVYINQIHETQFTVKANTRIEDFNQYFHTEFTHETVDTIGDFITESLGRLPKRHESIILDGLEFKVLNADKRRLRLLQITAQKQGA